MALPGDGFKSQHPHGSSQLSATPIPGSPEGSRLPFSGARDAHYIWLHTDKRTHKVKSFFKLSSHPSHSPHSFLSS